MTCERWSQFHGGTRWRTTEDGAVEIEGEGVPRTKGEPTSMRLYLALWGREIMQACLETRVPVPILLMTIATENGGAKVTGHRLELSGVRREPGYVSDESTPHRISVPPCHVLISTARAALDKPTLGRIALLNVSTNLRAAAHYMAGQAQETEYDPILTAAAYNAGGLYATEEGQRLHNRFHLRSWPGHLERAAQWYNDAVAVLAEWRDIVTVANLY